MKNKKIILFVVILNAILGHMLSDFIRSPYTSDSIVSMTNMEMMIHNNISFIRNIFPVLTGTYGGVVAYFVKKFIDKRK